MQPIAVPVETAGVFVITIVAAGQTPPTQLSALMTTPMINCRILPNYDYSRFYTIVNGKPVATAALDFSVLYAEVFRNYYLLYPAMSQVMNLSDPTVWQGSILTDPNYGLKTRISESSWDKPIYMPRTRDLSRTRRELVQAYCDKYGSPTSSKP